ncbi:hypothetical protein, no similarity [Maudiozyma saulgeensis]|uniref:Uncharacterized protein n=1 Tax=Maudiozyma saulgeensis TaxID=1789683 RepID=A0A1X7R648_9SACH|nr:hypothetical protein, no similarity [Kazachstania saulgeensis]
MMKREPTRLTLTDSEIADMIVSLETRKFDEQMKATKLLEQKRNNRQPLEIDSSNIFGIRSLENFNGNISQGHQEYPKSTNLSDKNFIHHTNNIPNDMTPEIASYTNNEIPLDMDRLDVNRNLIQSYGSDTDNNGTNRSSLSTYPAYSQQSGTITNYIRNISASSNIGNSQLNEEEVMFEESNSHNQPNPFYMADH